MVSGMRRRRHADQPRAPGNASPVRGRGDGRQVSRSRGPSARISAIPAGRQSRLEGQRHHGNRPQRDLGQRCRGQPTLLCASRAERGSCDGQSRPDARRARRARRRRGRCLADEPTDDAATCRVARLSPSDRPHASPPMAVNDIAATRIVWRSDGDALVCDPDGHLHQLSR